MILDEVAERRTDPQRRHLDRQAGHSRRRDAVGPPGARARTLALTRAYIGIGSNLDDPVRQVRKAVDALRALGEVTARLITLSHRAVGKDRSARIRQRRCRPRHRRFRPRPLLQALKWLERELGRDEQGERWGPRRIDFDILAFGDERVDDGDLVIPHPRLHERAFALVPLAEIAPAYASMRDALSPLDRAGVSIIATGSVAI